MKVTSIALDDECLPTSMTVTMSIVEANAIAGIFGQLNSIAAVRLGFSADDDVHEGLSRVLVKFYDDGYLFRVPRFAALNEKQP